MPPLVRVLQPVVRRAFSLGPSPSNKRAILFDANGVCTSSPFPFPHAPFHITTSDRTLFTPSYTFIVYQRKVRKIDQMTDFLINTLGYSSAQILPGIVRFFIPQSFFPTNILLLPFVWCLVSSLISPSCQTSFSLKILT